MITALRNARAIRITSTRMDNENLSDSSGGAVETGFGRQQRAVRSYYKYRPSSSYIAAQFQPSATLAELEKYVAIKDRPVRAVEQVVQV